MLVTQEASTSRPFPSVPVNFRRFQPVLSVILECAVRMLCAVSSRDANQQATMRDSTQTSLSLSSWRAFQKVPPRSLWQEARSCPQRLPTQPRKEKRREAEAQPCSTERDSRIVKHDQVGRHRTFTRTRTDESRLLSSQGLNVILVMSCPRDTGAWPHTTNACRTTRHPRSATAGRGANACRSASSAGRSSRSVGGPRGSGGTASLDLVVAHPKPESDQAAL